MSLGYMAVSVSFLALFSGLRSTRRVRQNYAFESICFNIRTIFVLSVALILVLTSLMLTVVQNVVNSVLFFILSFMSSASLLLFSRM